MRRRSLGSVVFPLFGSIRNDSSLPVKANCICNPDQWCSCDLQKKKHKIIMVPIYTKLFVIFWRIDLQKSFTTCNPQWKQGTPSCGFSGQDSKINPVENFWFKTMIFKDQFLLHFVNSFKAKALLFSFESGGLFFIHRGPEPLMTYHEYFHLWSTVFYPPIASTDLLSVLRNFIELFEDLQ